MNKDQEEFLESLREVKVFISSSMILGIPTGVLLAGSIIGIYMSIFMSVLLGVLFLLVYLVSMFLIHRDDPEALYIWIKAISGVEVWLAGKPCKKRTIIILEDG
jgi:type IV secretory pathway VirB3-like protein